MLNARDWERVDVRGEGERRQFVIRYKGGRTSTFDLKPSSPSAPALWHANAFSVTATRLLDGGVGLSILFCYRGYVRLALREKAGDSPAVR